ncbi:hypothetical protein [Roseitranquillus sediminis]|uniref:hypothetical protein n=1 Tax=Roseitranquillus sediminis TaxID=2809051 RepID=UPI001D0C193E|nr:hypothetical protein [Roseitranquillus sediminis]MBM9596314.1 hypothetical protein [Roseitranquillus sediminis]
MAAIAMLGLLAACAGQPLEERPEPIGDFRLGHAIALAESPTKGPFSREATPEQLKAAVDSAVRARLGRYDGDGLYHLGIVVGGYVLAQPGVPIVYQPKSILMLDVTVFDNATQQKLNPEPKRITAFEGLQNTVPILGSGLTRGADEQLANLAEQAAVQIEDWLRENPQWFEPEPEQQRVPFSPAATPPPTN